MLHLRPMTDAEWAALRETEEAEYARELARTFDTPVDEQREAAARAFTDPLPQGLATPNHYLWSLADDDGPALGALWVRVEPEHRRAFIFDIVVDPAQRGQGYGSRMLAMLEDELRTRGVRRIGLNVFADNPGAIRLYARHGYVVTNQTMQKTI
jgi:ribosomal protein S18 acetylase RimI-like enzyme